MSSGLCHDSDAAALLLVFCGRWRAAINSVLSERNQKRRRAVCVGVFFVACDLVVWREEDGGRALFLVKREDESDVFGFAFRLSRVAGPVDCHMTFIRPHPLPPLPTSQLPPPTSTPTPTPAPRSHPSTAIPLPLPPVPRRSGACVGEGSIGSRVLAWQCISTCCSWCVSRLLLLCCLRRGVLCDIYIVVLFFCFPSPCLATDCCVACQRLELCSSCIAQGSCSPSSFVPAFSMSVSSGYIFL